MLSSWVAPGVFEVFASLFRFAIALMSDDLPTFDRPTMAISLTDSGSWLWALADRKNRKGSGTDITCTIPTMSCWRPFRDACTKLGPRRALRMMVDRWSSTLDVEFAKFFTVQRCGSGLFLDASACPARCQTEATEKQDQRIDTNRIRSFSKQRDSASLLGVAEKRVT